MNLEPNLGFRFNLRRSGSDPRFSTSRKKALASLSLEGKVEEHLNSMAVAFMKRMVEEDGWMDKWIMEQRGGKLG